MTSGSSETNMEQQFALGCALQVQCGSTTTPTVVAPPPAAPTVLATRLLRHYLAQARARGNVLVPRDVLDRAQHDFLQRRITHRAVTGERELHQWLTLTRLHARSRAAAVATLADWEAALRIHQAMRATTTTRTTTTRTTTTTWSP